jgi:DNA repair photolyase
MPLIYQPKGKAREYSPLALNIYSGGCDHGCRYCYCTGIFRGAWSQTPKARDLRGLDREAAKCREQILLSFVGDPYCQADVAHQATRRALQVLREAQCSVAVLTKGGVRCLRDLDLFIGWPAGRVKVGATLTSWGTCLQQQWEPGAASPCDRIDALRQLHDAGVKTWASIEPVIDPVESLAVIDASLPYVDAYKVGRWNHDARANAIDWEAFARQACDMIRAAGKRLYVKHDLQPHLLPGYLTAEEMDQDSLALPPRP